MFKSKKVEKEKKEMLVEFSKLIAYLMQVVDEKTLDRCYEVGKQAHYKFFENKKKRKNKNVEVLEINARSKEDAIKQIKSLELEKDIEEDLIKIISKN